MYDFIMSFGIEFWFLLKYLKFIQFKEKPQLTFNVLYLGNNKLINSYLGKKYLLINEELMDDFNQIKTIVKQKKIDTIIFDNEIVT